MSSLIWFLVVFLAVDAVELFGKDSLPKSDLQLARSEVLEAFKSLLQRALDPEGTYHRDLLITAGVVPAPPGYTIPKDEGSGKPQEIPLSPEMRDHFKKHITDILISLEKLDSALNRLFKEWMSQSQIVDLKDSSHPKLTKHLMSCKTKRKIESAVDVLSEAPKEIHSNTEQASNEIDCGAEINSRSAACKDRSPEILKLPKLPEEDFIITPESERASENQFIATDSVVDKITTEYIKVFSEIPESSTSSLNENSMAEQGEGTVTLTPLDDEFIMHLMSSSVSPSLNDFSSSADESSYPEKDMQHTTEFPSTPDADTDSNLFEASEVESDSLYLSPKYGSVLTIEEVKLLDKSLPLRPELKYQVISTSRPDMDSLSGVQFFAKDDTHSTFDETSSPKPIGKKRRRVNPRDISIDEPIFYQAPTPEKMILRYYRDIPDTSFTCENKTQPGFYADQETDCQVFHVCWPGRRESFLCPVGSLFNQRVLSCDNFNHTNCSISHAYFDVNTAFQEYDDAKAHNVTPMPDPMMQPIQNDSGTTEVVATKSDIVELFEADLHFSEMITKANITELWDYVPVKAKVFVYPEPADLKEFLAQHHHHKIRKSKDVRGLETATDVEEGETGVLDDILEKRQRIEANIIRVLKKLSRKHRN